MIKRLLAPLVLALAVAACTTPVVVLEVTSVVPEPDAIDVPVDSVVAATFSVAIDPTTVDGNFTLAQGAVPVAGTTAYNAATRTATFTPDADLDYETEYTVTVSGSVATAGGVTLEGDVAWSFTTEDAPIPPDVIDGVTVDPATASVVEGDTVQLTATVSVVSGSPSTAVTWTSDDEDVATVDATGLVTAVAPGTATITATSVFDATFAGTAAVTVTAAPDPDVIDGVTVDPATASVVEGGTVQLTATVSVVSGSPSTAVTWTSDDEDVATVDATGLVTAVAPGTATITATSVFDGTFSGSADVTVVALLEVADDYAPYAADADVNTAISIAFPAITGGLAPFAFELVAGELPADFVTQDVPARSIVGETFSVGLDPATGEIAGATGLPGVFTGTVEVTDALGQTATADFELDLGLALRYTSNDLETTEDTFEYPTWDDEPFFVVPGDRVQVSGVADTDALPDDFLADLQFSLVFVSSNPTTADGLEQESFVITTAQGAITQVAPVPAITQWIYDVVLDHGPSAASVTYQVRFFHTSDPFID